MGDLELDGKKSVEVEGSYCDYQTGDRRAWNGRKCGLATSWEAGTEKRADTG